MKKAVLVFPFVVTFAIQMAFAADATTAPEQSKQGHGTRFEAVDTNGDGGLSKEELARTSKNEFKVIKLKFDEMDANKDGKVTQGEIKGWMLRQRYKNGM